MGELGSSNGLAAYTLATAMREIHLQPSGHLSIMGFGSRAPFFRELLDKLKIEPFVMKRNSYKNALNNFTEKRYTSAHREATDHLLGTLFEQCVHDISTSLGLDPRQVRRQIDHAPLSAEAALKNGLITGVSYMSDLQDALREKVRSNINNNEVKKQKKPVPVEVKVERYVDALQAQETLDLLEKRMKAAMSTSFWPTSSSSEEDEMLMGGKGEAGVALVYARGAIMNGASQDQDSIQSSTFSKLLDQVHKMKKVKAVVLRVDTPGGSVVGSDEIYNQIRRLQAKKIKVVISMGNVAASGGYYISAPADAIFASPATLTGSIGVIMGKFNFEGFLKDLGITLDEGRLFGKNANMLSATTSYTRQQKRKLNQMIDEVYEEFLRKVSDGRSIPMRQVRRLANGRVWTGEDAYRLGLVDHLGGLDATIVFAKELAGLPEDAQVRQVRAKVSFLAQLKRSFALTMSALLVGDVEEDPLVNSIVAKLKLMKMFQGQGMLVLEPDLVP
jgi:protease-4